MKYNKHVKRITYILGGSHMSKEKVVLEEKKPMMTAKEEISN